MDSVGRIAWRQGAPEPVLSEDGKLLLRAAGADLEVFSIPEQGDVPSCPDTVSAPGSVRHILCAADGATYVVCRESGCDGAPDRDHIAELRDGKLRRISILPVTAADAVVLRDFLVIISEGTTTGPGEMLVVDRQTGFARLREPLPSRMAALARGPDNQVMVQLAGTGMARVIDVTRRLDPCDPGQAPIWVSRVLGPGATFDIDVPGPTPFGHEYLATLFFYGNDEFSSSMSETLRRTIFVQG